MLFLTSVPFRQVTLWFYIFKLSLHPQQVIRTVQFESVNLLKCSQSCNTSIQTQNQIEVGCCHTIWKWQQQTSPTSFNSVFNSVIINKSGSEFFSFNIISFSHFSFLPQPSISMLWKKITWMDVFLKFKVIFLSFRKASFISQTHFGRSLKIVLTFSKHKYCCTCQKSIFINHNHLNLRMSERKKREQFFVLAILNKIILIKKEGHS